MSSSERGRFYSANALRRNELSPGGSPASNRPSSAEGRRGLKHGVPAAHNKTGLQKIAKLFRKEQRKGEKMRVPPGFFDESNDVEGYRPQGGDSPETSPNAFRRNRSYSVGSRTALKIKRGKEREESFFMWKPVKVNKLIVTTGLVLLSVEKKV